MVRKQDNGKRTISSEKLVAHVVKVVRDEGIGQTVGQLGLGRDKLDNSMTSIKDIEDVVPAGTWSLRVGTIVLYRSKVSACLRTAGSHSSQSLGDMACRRDGASLDSRMMAPTWDTST